MSGAKYFDELRVVSFLVIYAGEGRMLQRGGDRDTDGNVGTKR